MKARHSFRTDRGRQIRRWGQALTVGSVALLVIACSADLHEMAGPLVPVPNLLGQVLRDGIPASGLRVRLEDEDGNTLSSERTDGAGHFGFTEVGEGSWAVRVESDLSSDFARITREVVFLTADTSLTLPGFEMDLQDLRVVAPEDSVVAPVPGFFSPLTFTWEGHAAAKQVRFFEETAGGGEAIWFSSNTDGRFLRWNGIGTENSHVSVPVTPGGYRWHLRLQEPGGLEYLTHFRHITLVP